MSLENRVNRIEEAIQIMKICSSATTSGWKITFMHYNESRQDFDLKINALIDSQIRNQDEIGELKEASKSILKRVEKLENN